jgi:hypothetical protein
MHSFVPLRILQGTLRGEGGNNHVKELIKEPSKSKGEKVKTQSKEPILLR